METGAVVTVPVLSWFKCCMGLECWCCGHVL